MSSHNLLQLNHILDLTGKSFSGRNSGQAKGPVAGKQHRGQFDASLAILAADRLCFCAVHIYAVQRDMSFGVSMKPLSFVVVCGSFLLSACTILPSSGPKGSVSLPAINQASKVPHVVVNVTPEVISVLQSEGSDAGFGALRGAKGASPTQIGVGDVVGVTIFEASPGGLFVPAESTNSNGNFVNLPDQQVDSSGNISVPYAGTIHVSGSEPGAIQSVIEQRLGNRAIEPQAVVAIKSQ